MYENLHSRFQIIEQEKKELIFDICNIMVIQTVEKSMCVYGRFLTLGRKNTFL